MESRIQEEIPALKPVPDLPNVLMDLTHRLVNCENQLASTAAGSSTDVIPCRIEEQLDDLNRRLGTAETAVEQMGKRSDTCKDMVDTHHANIADLQTVRGDVEHQLSSMQQQLRIVRQETAAFPGLVESCEKKVDAFYDKAFERTCGGDPPAQQRMQRLEQKLDCLDQAVWQSLDCLRTSAGDVTRRLNDQHAALASLEASFREQKRLVCELASKADAQRDLPVQLTEKLRQICRDSHQAADRQQDIIQELEDRLGSHQERLDHHDNKIALTEQDVQGLSEQSGSARAELQAVAGHLQRAIGAAEQRLGGQLVRREELLEGLRRLGGQVRERLEKVAAAAPPPERRLEALEGRCAAVELRQRAQDQGLAAQRESLRRLAAQYEELPQRLEARVAEAHAAVKGDLATSTLASFEGEMRLWARMRELDGRGILDGAAPQQPAQWMLLQHEEAPHDAL